MKKLQKIISQIMILVMLFSLVGCAAGESKTPSTIDTDGKNSGALVVNGVEVKDAFVTLNVDTLEENEVSVEEIKIEDIIVNCVTVEEITVLETEVVSLNDEFVYLAYQNFVSYYDADIDFQKFLTDIAIGGACIIVCVTLSVAGGPIGTFFGAVITSEFSTAALAISAAIDAAVSGYQAYQEGGDASYIVGHMLNGVAEGFKWGAMLAPVSGAVSGIQTIRAVSEIKKLKGFEDKSDQVIEALIKDYSKIIKAAEETGTSDAALKKLYKKMSGELSEETTEDVFILAVRNQANITDCILKYHPFNVEITDAEAKTLRAATTKEQQIQRLLDDGIPENKLAEIKKKIIKAKTWKDIEDIEVIDDNNITREIIEKNGKTNNIKRLEFLQLFGDELSDEVCEDFLRTKWGKEVLNAIKNCIAQPNAYSKLNVELDEKKCMQILSDAESLFVLKKRFGSKNVDRLLEVRRWHQCMDKSYIELRKPRVKSTKVKANTVEEIREGFRRGKYKTLDDVRKVSEVVADNLQESVNEFNVLLEKSGLLDKNKDFFTDLVCRSCAETVTVEKELLKALVQGRISKNEIIEKYGQRAYDTLVEKIDQVLKNYPVQKTIDNNSLIKDLFADSLRKKKYAEDAINRILNGVPRSMWGLLDSEMEEIEHLVAIYYRKTDRKCFSNYMDAVMEKKVQEGKLPKEAAEQIKCVMENGGIPSDGYIGAGIYMNYEKKLREGINYKEYDIYPYRHKIYKEEPDRGAYRLVFGEDGHVYYSDDHLENFTKII